jgi:hypothetical protein
MSKVVAIALLIAALGLIAWWRRDRPLMPESQFIVVVSDDEIRVTDPDGAQHRVALRDLGSVRIRTNDSGPWGTDVIWGFHGLSGAVSAVVPGGATGEKEMIVALSKLPGWRDDAVIQAMGSTSNREFVCWEREPSQ